MSILAKLLKKGDDRQEAGEILPGLQQAVTSAEKSPGKRRLSYLLIAAGATVALVGGGLLVVYLQTRTPTTPVMHQQAVAPLQPQTQPSSSKAIVAPPPPVEPTAETRQPQTNKHSVKKQRGRLAASAAKGSRAKKTDTITSKEKKQVARDRATIDAWLFAARTAENRKDYNLAMLQYKKVLEADPQNYRIMNNLASICLNLRLHDEALSYAHQALKQKPEYVSALVNGGIAQGRLGHEGNSQAMLARAVTIEPANRQALYNLALAEERGNALDGALTTWRRLADTGDANGVLGMARIKERRGEQQEALRLYREVTAHPEAGQRVKEAARERIGMLDR